VSFTPVPFSSPVVNPTIGSLLNRVPYTSVSQFEAAATSVDVSQLVPGGSAAANKAALAELIAEASAWADSYCFPFPDGGQLAATLETDTGTTFAKRDGMMWLVCRFKPVLELDSLAIGVSPDSLQPINSSALAGITFKGKVIKIPAFTAMASTVGGVVDYFPPWQSTPRLSGNVWAYWTYVTGYPHAKLAATATQGTESMQVTSILGVYSGTKLMVYDGPSSGANNEIVQVSSASTTAGVTTLTLASPLLYTHTLPAAPDAILVSGLPPNAVRAVTLLTTALVKQRGSNALALKDLSAPEQRVAGPGGAFGSMEDVAVALELLDEFRTVTAGSA
jgi:hypothetical protein